MVRTKRELRSFALWLFVPATLGLLALVPLSAAVDVSLSKFMRDPAALLGASPFTGFVSNVGALVWMSTAAISAFGAHSLYRWDGWNGRVGLLVAGTGLSLMLLMDDFFMFHETVWVQTLGWDERVLFLIYGTLVGGSLWAARAALRDTALGFLFAAGFLFATSIGIDQLPEGSLPGHVLIEDGAKFLGIVGWFGYFASMAWAFLDESGRGKLVEVANA